MPIASEQAVLKLTLTDSPLRHALESRLGKPIGIERLAAERALEGRVLEPGAAPATLLPDDDGARYDLDGRHVRRIRRSSVAKPASEEPSESASGSGSGPGSVARSGQQGVPSARGSVARSGQQGVQAARDEGASESKEKAAASAPGADELLKAGGLASATDTLLLHHGNVGAAEAEELSANRGKRSRASDGSADASDEEVVPGYTLSDLVTLSRSRVAGQRVIALRCISKLLHRRRQQVTRRLARGLGSRGRGSPNKSSSVGTEIDGGRSNHDQIVNKADDDEDDDDGVVRPVRLPRMLVVAVRVATADDNLAALAAGLSAAAALVGTDDDLELPGDVFSSEVGDCI